MSSDKIHKLAEKLSNKLAQQATPATTIPSAVVQNYTKLVDAYSRMLVNATSNLSDEAIQQSVAIMKNYRATAAQTSPENAKLIAKALASNIETVQSNLNEVKQLLAAINSVA